MKLRFFAVPALDPGDSGAELAAFLANNRVVGIDKNLVQDGARSFWAVCVTVTEVAAKAESAGRARKRVDYKDVLPPEQFAVFARLREVRKALASGDGVPAYAVFTNEQLAAMVTQGVRTKAALQAIAGVGEARAQKYGARVLAVLREISQGGAVQAEEGHVAS